MNAPRLYVEYLAIAFRGQMQYRASFVMLTLGQFLVNGIEILGVWALFARFRSLEGWRLEEVALFYGLINVALGIAGVAAGGFDKFAAMVKSGEFDRVLLRPRSTALQIAARQFEFRRTGRMLQGLVVLVWAGAALDVSWSAGRIGLVILAVLGGAAMFYGLFVLQATLAFWTTETLELMNAITYGGCEAGRYPLSIYRAWLRRFFTFIVPLACVSYFPAMAILGRDDPVLGSPMWFRWLSPLVGALFLMASLQVWNLGVRHYHSTGS